MNKNKIFAYTIWFWTAIGLLGCIWGGSWLMTHPTEWVARAAEITSVIGGGIIVLGGALLGIFYFLEGTVE